MDTNSGSVGGDSMENKSFQGNLKEHKIREPRLRRPPTWMIDYMSGSELFDNEKTIQLALFADNDPITFDDAMKSSKCRKAMDLEIEAIVKNNTWELTKLLAWEKSIEVKWIYKAKLKENGEVDKYEAKLVANGNTKKYEVNYFEVFAPSAGMIRFDSKLLVNLLTWCKVSFLAS